MTTDRGGSLRDTTCRYPGCVLTEGHSTDHVEEVLESTPPEQVEVDDEGEAGPICQPAPEREYIEDVDGNPLSRFQKWLNGK